MQSLERHCDRGSTCHVYRFMVFRNLCTIVRECLIESRRRREPQQSPLDHAGHVKVMIQCHQNEFHSPSGLTLTSVTHSWSLKAFSRTQLTLSMIVKSFRLRFSCVVPDHHTVRLQCRHTCTPQVSNPILLHSILQPCPSLS